MKTEQSDLQLKEGQAHRLPVGQAELHWTASVTRQNEGDQGDQRKNCGA